MKFSNLSLQKSIKGVQIGVLTEKVGGGGLALKELRKDFKSREKNQNLQKTTQ